MYIMESKFSSRIVFSSYEVLVLFVNLRVNLGLLKESNIRVIITIFVPFYKIL